MIEIVWEFEVGEARRARFEEIYGPHGDWARLFARHPGYRGSLLSRDLTGPGRYRVVDRWDEVKSFEAFRAAHASDYEALDRACEALTLSERRVGRFEVMGVAEGPRPRLCLDVMPGELAVVRLAPGAPLPEWARTGALSGILWTPQETSIVCAAAAVPGGERAEPGWRALALRGPIPFATTGVLASLTEPLARAEIGLFALSTYDTDYLLVKEVVRARAQETLRAAGHQVNDP